MNLLFWLNKKVQVSNLLTPKDNLSFYDVLLKKLINGTYKELLRRLFEFSIIHLFIIIVGFAFVLNHIGVNNLF